MTPLRNSSKFWIHADCERSFSEDPFRVADGDAFDRDFALLERSVRHAFDQASIFPPRRPAYDHDFALFHSVEQW